MFSIFDMCIKSIFCLSNKWSVASALVLRSKAGRPINAYWPNACLLFCLCAWNMTKNQVVLSLRLRVPLAETLVLGVVACCEGNDHKTCLDCCSQLQLKGQPTPSTPILLSPSSLWPSPIPQARNSCSVTAVRPPSQAWVLIIGPEWGQACMPLRLPLLE